MLSAPAWALVWLETRIAGQRDPLVHLECVGRTRRWRQRRGARVPATIDRRAIERRTQDLFGAPFRCAHLRRDVGPASRWLARRSLDRLPLLLNVLRGDMALVGPRPETSDEVLRWHALSPEFERRFAVLPGITGLAQLSACSGGGPAGIACRIQYDLYYVDHRSLLLDVRTLARTLKVVLSGPGAPPGSHRLGARRGTRGTGTRPDPLDRAAGASADAIAASASTAVKGVTQ